MPACTAVVVKIALGLVEPTAEKRMEEPRAGLATFNPWVVVLGCGVTAKATTTVCISVLPACRLALALVNRNCCEIGLRVSVGVRPAVSVVVNINVSAIVNKSVPAAVDVGAVPPVPGAPGVRGVAESSIRESLMNVLTTSSIPMSPEMG